MNDRKVKQVLYRVWYQWKEGEDKERLREGEYGGSTVYSCLQMEQ
jgi:hypothetical protein